MDRKPPDVTAPIRDNQTWNTCPDCGASWETVPAIPGLLHRTIRCVTCRIVDDVLGQM